MNERPPKNGGPPRLIVLLPLLTWIACLKPEPVEQRDPFDAGASGAGNVDAGAPPSAGAGGTGGGAGDGGGPGAGGDSGTGGGGGGLGASCGLMALQLTSAFEVPAGAWNTAGRGGGECPLEQPVEWANVYAGDQRVDLPEPPCARTPLLTMQPRMVPVRPAGEAVPYRLVLTNRNDPSCPPESWAFKPGQLSDGDVIQVAPTQKTIGGGESFEVCAQVSAGRERWTSGGSFRVDFFFIGPIRQRSAAFWHPVQGPQCRSSSNSCPTCSAPDDELPGS